VITLSQIILKEEKAMSCARIEGDDYIPGRLLFDGAAEAVVDAVIELEAPNAEGFFEGGFRDPETGDPLEDQLMNGRCRQNGQTTRIEFTRLHAGGNITTHYTDRVILVGGTSTVMLRGRFTRVTANQSGPMTFVSGDHETEKPT
jgi:hypothetical protein